MTTARRVIFVAAAYLGVALLFGALAGSVGPGPLRVAIRFGAFVASGIAFLLHLRAEFRRASPLRAAARVAFAVALGALTLAAAGPARNTKDRSRGMASLVLFPLVTAVPALVVAFGISSVATRRRTRFTSGNSPGAAA